MRFVFRPGSTDETINCMERKDIKYKVIIYGCGAFFAAHREDVERDYTIVGTIDKYDKSAKYNSIKDLQDEYDHILIMICKIDILIEVAREFACIGSIDFSRVIFGIEKYGILNGVAHIYLDQLGLYLSTFDGNRTLITDTDYFWKNIEQSVIPYLENRASLVEEKLIEIHKKIYELNWGRGTSLSYNHDNDLYYRLPRYGVFDFGLTACLSLRCIYNFKKPYVLDLGCADGFYYKRFYSHVADLFYVGCDSYSYSIQKARMNNPGQNAVFLNRDFAMDMPKPERNEFFTNVLWYASMQMFDCAVQEHILEEIRKRIGEKGILCGSATIGKNNWEYGISYFEDLKSLKALLESFFSYVYVYKDYGMHDYAVFVASQSPLYNT